MRISTAQIFQSGLATMQRAQVDLNHTSLQMATGRRILTPSDDPSGAAQSVQLNAAVKATEQYQRNSDYAKPKLELEESQMIALDNYMQRARELVVAGNSDSYNQENRNYIASEIRQLRDDIFGLANTQDANGEYLFGGTRLEKAPFVAGDEKQVSYVGAEGAGAVREIAITSNRRIAAGDTGDYVFMEIPERSGLLTEVVPKSNPPNSPNLKVPGVDMKSEVANLQESLDSAGQTFRIVFEEDGGAMTYKVLDPDGNSVKDSNGNLIGGPYIANEPIEFAGRRVTLSVPNTTPPTVPGDGDELISRPVKQISIFQTLDDIATAFEKSLQGNESREALSQASSIALRNLDAGLERVNEVRTSVGVRLNSLDTQSDLNDQRLVDLKTTLSEVRDLDYADAISRFKLQEVVLQAAQQSYVQVSRLSLFDFL
ncbi:flagellar hook-associated protein FlgL [Thiobaca trueperi]|uniref:Flagellar hook-associated protein 3 FlgL n=1 Tax=Thiobaca trueperi TaxID=127458 RepID=A0A4R3MW96_9GAMM|nr:flagellar hook-associated protein FlgL [Thiobaca trueperi]TCT20614.1 flagellar hook-associated protein 3 FlgL [Thiobaca trueperi]